MGAQQSELPARTHAASTAAATGCRRAAGMQEWQPCAIGRGKEPQLTTEDSECSGTSTTCTRPQHRRPARSCDEQPPPPDACMQPPCPGSRRRAAGGPQQAREGGELDFFRSCASRRGSAARRRGTDRCRGPRRAIACSRATTARASARSLNSNIGRSAPARSGAARLQEGGAHVAPLSAIPAHPLGKGRGEGGSDT
jgi:hypothetical protein